MDKPPYLQIVGPTTETTHDEEFLPLPFYPWDERPPTLPLEFDECATAIHLTNASIPAAAALLKIPIVRLNREIRRSPRLQRVVEEALEVIKAKMAGEVIQALDDPDGRRREWAVNKLLVSRMAQGHAFAPAPASSSQSASLTVDQPNRTMTFRWRTDQDTTPADELDSDARTIEG
jgi:hypothetical protein